MKGRVSINSSRRRELQSIVDVCRATLQTEKKAIDSTTLESCVVELIRETMRDLASAEDRWYGKDSLLHAAIERTETEIYEWLRKERVDFDISDLLRNAKAALKHTGKELQQLSGRLSESRLDKRVKPIATELSADSQPYAIHQIGLEGSPTGLLARPDSDKGQTLNFDRMEQLSCRIDGERFPVELFCDDHIFVVDDDGSVFVTVDGLPMQTVERVGDLLRKIVSGLYS